jgi:MFS family permease
VFISTLANSVCAAAWSASMSDLVPLNIRGKYFGSRNMIFGFWTLLVVLAAGQIVDATNNALHVFGLIFSCAALARLVGMFFLTRMRFPSVVLQKQTRSATLGEYLSVLKDRNYLVLLLFIGFWGMFLNLGHPFYNVYVLRELPFTVGDLTILTTLTSLGGLVSLRAWGNLSDRFGSKPVLMTCALVWGVWAFVSWIFAAPDRYLHLYVNYFVVGAMTAGFQLCQFNLMIKLVPTQAKSHYISVFFCFTSLLTAVGPVLGGKLLQVFPHQIGTILNAPLLNYHFLFLGSLGLCLLSTHILEKLKEPSERPLREVVRVMRNMREFNPLLGLASLAQFMFTPRALGKWAHESFRSLRRQTRDVTEVGEELVEGSWKEIKRRIEKPKRLPRDLDQPR